MNAIEYKEVEKITENGELYTRVKFKPTFLFIVIFIISIIMAVIGYIVPLKWVFVMGVAGLFYSSFTIFSIPDRWVLSIYDDALIIFSAEPKQRACRIDAKDIIEYNVGMTRKNCLYLKLRDGKEYIAKSYRYDKKVKKALSLTLKGKETKTIKNRNSNIK